MNRQQRRQAARLAKKGDRGSGRARTESQGFGSDTAGEFQAAVRFHQAGEFRAAAGIYRRILDRHPGHYDALHLLGLVAYQTGQSDTAVDLIGRALAINPKLAEAHNSLGAALLAQGKSYEALACFQRAVANRLDYAEAHSNLGTALKDQGKDDEAMAQFRRALAIDPNYARAHNNLGNLLKDDGKLDEAVACYRSALAINPDLASAHSNLLLSMHYGAAFTPEEILAESRRWDATHAAPRAKRIQPHANARDPERRLRIGYVSPDFRTHSVSYFVEPLLASHDRGGVEVFCYAEVPRPDEITARLQTLADAWRSTVGLSDAAVAERIREDRIDILVDLAGHTASNRLLVFAERPAPVQVTWLGYGATTGMTAMDYRLTDAVVDPAEEAGRFFSETLIRLPHAFFCYAPPAEAPEVASPPTLSNGHVTFGTFNNPTKVAPGAIEVWAQVLRETPGSRLLMKSNQLRDEALRRNFLDAFLSHGIDGESIEFMPKIPAVSEHLRAYGRVDIALDPFPYNGATTSLEAAWMGVPMIALRGDRFISRMGASILTRLGLTDLVAETPEDYVERAVALAKDLDRLANLRNDLRPRMQASPLCNAETFCREMESAYCDMWRRWCGDETGHE